MFSVRHQHGKIFGIVLCVLLVLSIYTGFVNVVSELFGHSFIETVSLSSRVSPGDGTRFAMGDTISVSAKVRHSNVYRLSVYDNSDHLVFEEVGAVKDSDVEVSVPIRPPAFNASRTYNLTFEAGVVGLPLLGVRAYDSSPATSFAVVKSLTRLNLTTSYNEAAHDLRSVAVLTTDQGLPVGNETVSFYVQPNVDFVRPDRGWMLLDSVLTDENGSAPYSCALSMMGGIHGLEARFQGGQDYGSSTATVQFNVSHAPTLLRIVRAEKTASSVSVLLRLTDPSGFPLGGKVLSFEALSVSAGALYAVTNDTGYVVMKFSGLVPGYVDSKITVLGDDYISRYQTFVRLVQNGSGMSVASEWGESGAGSLAIGEDGKRPAEATVFFAHGVRALDLSLDPVDVRAENVTPAADLPERINSTFFQFDAVPGGVTFYYYLNETLSSSTDATCTYERWEEGGEEEYGYLYKGSFFWYPSVCGNYNLTVVAEDNSTGVPIGEGNATVSVAPAYNNLVVYYPGAFCGDNMSLVVAFSRARTQSQTDGSGYFQTMDFAPTIVYDNFTYALDQPSQAPIIHLYLNGSEIDLNDTDGSGLCSYTYSTSTLPSSLNVTAAVDQNGRFQASNVSHVFSLIQLTVSDNPAVAADPSSFYMNYSMSVLNGTDITYINAGNLVETQVTVLNTSACNVATSLTTGHLVNRTATSTSAHVNIPTGCTYFRVVFACDNSSKLRDPWCDITKDGRVDIKDIQKIAKAFGKIFGYKGYDWTLDWNVDRKIDIKDISALAKDFGNADIHYLPFHNVTYSPYFDYRGISVGSDKGDVSLDSRGFGQVPAGAQWLNVSCEADIEFFSSVVNGSAVTDNSGRAGLTMDAIVEGVWVVEDVVATPLNLTVSVDAAVTQLNASLCMANYYYVFNRTVAVSLSWDSQMQSTVLTACADTYADSLIPGKNFGNLTSLDVGYDGDFIGFIRFNMSTIPANACILSAKLNVYESGFSGTGNYGVHRIDGGSWDELTLNYANMPTYLSDASCTLDNVPSQTGIWLSFNVTSDVDYWSSNPDLNYGFALVGDPSSSSIIALYSKDHNNLMPSLEISYLNGSQDVCISTYDEAKQCPAPGMSVNFTVNGNLQGSGSTNDSGVWDFGVWSPPSGGVWSLGASSSATGECTAGSTSTKFNIGLPTSMVSLDDGSDLSPGNIVSNFSLCSSGLFNVSGVTVSYCVTGTLTNGTRAVYSNSSTTLANGTVRFEWYTGDVGTFSVNATFGGDTSYAPCEAGALVAVDTLPLSVLFSISPSEFVPGDDITLNATIINPQTNERYTEHDVSVQFFKFPNGTLPSPIGTVDSSGGIALLSDVAYPSDGTACAYNATILGCTDEWKTVSNVVSSPVQLTVGKPITMYSDIVHDVSSSVYEFEYSFADANNPLYQGGRRVSVKINDTEFTYTTDPYYGVAEFTRDFPPINNSLTTYIITSSFDGENPVSASATSATLGGTSYPACTTVQYNGYKPSSNSTVLTVSPQSTQATTLTKTPEELQQDAKQNGTLRVWNEFSWFYPWYRFHTVYLLGGVEQFDIGIGPLGGNIFKAWENFVDRVSTYAREIVPDLFADYVLGEMVAWAGAMSGNLLVWAVTAGISIAVKLGLLWAESWNSLEKLYTSYVAQLVSLMIEVGSFIAQFSLGHLTAIAGSLMKLTSALWAVLTLIANILLDITFFMTIIDMRISQLSGQ